MSTKTGEGAYSIGNIEKFLGNVSSDMEPDQVTRAAGTAPFCTGLCASHQLGQELRGLLKANWPSGVGKDSGSWSRLPFLTNNGLPPRPSHFLA